MQLKTFDKKGVRMVAHRGLSGVETENTIAAFIAAANRSYYGIETDIYVTTDGKYVCIHDGNTLRVAGTECDVTKSSYDEIIKIRYTDFSDGTAPREDLRIPRLEDYISICKKYGKHSVLELKQAFTPEQITEIIQILKKADHLQNTTFISFIPSNLFILRQLLPKQSVMLLSDRLDDEVKEGIVKYNIDIDILFTVLNEENIKWLKSHNITVNCWTVDGVEDAQKLADLGVDFITTNCLE